MLKVFPYLSSGSWFIKDYLFSQATSLLVLNQKKFFIVPTGMNC